MMISPERLALLQAYRSAVATRYQPVLPVDITSRIHGSTWVSAKVDGELWFLLNEGGSWILASPNGRTVEESVCPILVAADSAGLNRDVIIAGELHAPSSGDDRERVGGVSSALGSGELSGLAFAAFDLASGPGIDPVTTPYVDRLALLEILPTEGALYRVPVESAADGREVEALYRAWVEEKHREGIVVRAEDGRSFKVKPSLDVDAAIIGFTERHADDGGREVRSLLVALAHPEGGWVPLSAVGGVGESATRRSLYEQLSGLACPSDFQKTSDNSGISYRFVEPSLVAEVKVTDVQAEDTKGQRIRDPRLVFGPGGWKVDGWVPSASLLHPSLQRIRSDKQPTSADCGWNQIERLLPSPISTDSLVVTEPRVVRRQVWTKTSKDKVDVRKLVVWETGKQALGFAAYVVHWTDFSAGRKAPLAREVRLAPTEEEAMRVADQLVEDNVKKGWEPVS